MVAEIGNRIHMSDKTQCFAVLQTFCSRKMCINVTVFIQRHIRDSKAFQFLHKKPGQVKLALGRGRRRAFFIAGGGYFYIG